MTAREKHITYGMGVAVHYARQIDPQFAGMLWRELNLTLEECELACDPVDLPDIRKLAVGE